MTGGQTGISKKSRELYITLIRTFGIISIVIPLVLFFVNEFVYEQSLVFMMALGAVIIVFSLVWNYMAGKRDKHSQFIED